MDRFDPQLNHKGAGKNFSLHQFFIWAFYSPEKSGGIMCLYTVTAQNFDLNPIPCVDLQNPTNGKYFQYNKNWIMARFKEGLTIKMLDTPTTSFIEYVPAESSWRGILAPGYTFIHHLFVEEDDADHQLKSELLRCSEQDSKDTNGMLTVLDHTNIETLAPFYEMHGFSEIAHLPGFVLMGKKFIESAKVPTFALSVYEYSHDKSHDVIISYADQSEFILYYLYRMKMEFERLGFQVKMRKLESISDARQSGSPYGTLGIFLDGEFLSHRLMNETQIEELIGTLDLNEMYPEVHNLYDAPHHRSFY
ncbi:MAG: hypothetical protein CL666_01130 [Balneola sp.]|nr:hypothetical protein [Balneola sp.]